MFKKTLLFTVAACAIISLAGNFNCAFAQEAAQTAAASPKSLLDLPAAHLALLVGGFIAIGFALFSSFSLYISISAYAACKSESKTAAFIPAIAAGTQSLYASVIAYFMVQRSLEAPVNCALAAFICFSPLILSAYAQAVAGAACIRALDDPKSGLNAGFAILMVGMCETAAIVSFVMALLMVLKK